MPRQTARTALAKLPPPTLTRLHFIENKGATFGGAIAFYVESGSTASPQVSDVTFTGNHALRQGGAVHVQIMGPSATVAPRFLRRAFIDNAASPSIIGDGGGAMFLHPGTQGGTIEVSVLNSTVSGNHTTGAYGRGGAIYNNGTGGNRA